MAGKHWRETKGYETYQVGAEMIREAGMENAGAAYVEANVYGTPEQVLGKCEERRDLIGDVEINLAFSYAGLPYDKVEASMTLFGDKVVPQLQKMKPRTAAAA